MSLPANLSAQVGGGLARPAISANFCAASIPQGVWTANTDSSLRLAASFPRSPLNFKKAKISLIDRALKVKLLYRRFFIALYSSIYATRPFRTWKEQGKFIITSFGSGYYAELDGCPYSFIATAQKKP